MAGKLIYSLFILWLGGLAPLVYFDLLATDHFVQPYRLAIFELPSRTHPLPEALAAQLMQRFKQQLTNQPDFFSSQNHHFGLIHLFQSSLDNFYFITGISLLLLIYAGRLNRANTLTGASADLPPLKKPPRQLSPIWFIN